MVARQRCPRKRIGFLIHCNKAKWFPERTTRCDIAHRHAVFSEISAARLNRVRLGRRGEGTSFEQVDAMTTWIGERCLIEDIVPKTLLVEADALFSQVLETLREFGHDESECRRTYNSTMQAQKQTTISDHGIRIRPCFIDAGLYEAERLVELERSLNVGRVNADFQEASEHGLTLRTQTHGTLLGRSTLRRFDSSGPALCLPHDHIDESFCVCGLCVQCGNVVVGRATTCQKQGAIA